MTSPSDQPHADPGFLKRIRLSILSDPVIPRTDAGRKRYLFRNLVLHFRPATVPVDTLRFSLTWGLGGMAAVLVLLQIGTGVRALSDEEALMRYTALRYFPQEDPRERLAAAMPLLYDPVKAVRIEAAQLLTTVPPSEMSAAARKRLQTEIDEYQQAMAYTGDFPASRHNLGNLYSNMGQHEKAVENYRKAIEIDREFYPAKVNLAMVYNRLGKNAEAERLLREVATAHPDLYDIKYSLGLLLVEEKKYQEAADFLIQAAQGLPQRSRIHYNLGLLLQQLQRDPEAEKALKQALAIEPNQSEYLYALAVFYLQRRQFEKARQLAEKMMADPTSRTNGERLLTVIEQQRSTP